MLFVASQPPRPGETLRFEESTTYDIQIPDNVRHGTFRFVTDETVRSTEHDVIDELEVRFVEGKYHPDHSKPLVELSGTYRVRGNADGKSTFTRDDGASISNEHEDALAAYARGDVGVAHWLLALLTDHSFRVGEEAEFPAESVIAPKGESKSARITLESITANRATFAIAGEFHKGNMGLHYAGTAILDTQLARLVSMDTVAELMVPPESRITSRIVDEEKFHYANTGPSSVATTSDTCAARTLYIPRSDPKAGERYSVEHRFNVDEMLTNAASKEPRHLHGGWTVAAETHVIDDSAMDVLVKSERIAPLSFGDAPATTESHENEKIGVTLEHNTIQMRRNGAPIPGSDFAAAVALTGSYTKEWSTRLVTKRTYEVGREQTFVHEAIAALSPAPVRVRVMLVSIENDIAVFKLDFKTVVDLGRPFPMFMRGQMRFEIKQSRPLDVHLDAAFDMPEGSTATGDYALDWKFRY